VIQQRCPGDVVLLREDTAAEADFRMAWASYLFCTDPRGKWAYRRLFHALAPCIANGTDDPRWDDFVTTLPGWDTRGKEELCA